MTFAPTSAQSVKSNNQRALLTQWQQLSAGRLFPDISDFAPPERELKNLILWAVEGDGATRRFRMRRQAERLTETVAADFTGKTLDEVAPDPLRPFVLASAHECVEARCAVYSVITTIDANAHVVECERLLLPFGRDGVVQYMIAALQLISYQGSVDRGAIAHEFETRCEATFCGLIPANAHDGAPIALPPRHVPKPSEPPAAPQGSPPRAAAKPTERRQAQRRVVRKTGRIKARNVSEICTVRDISAGGAELEVANATRVPDSFTLVLEMESAGRSCAVVWRKERQLGVQFT